MTYDKDQRVLDTLTGQEARIVRVDRDPGGDLYLLDESAPITEEAPDRWRIESELKRIPKRRQS